MKHLETLGKSVAQAHKLKGFEVEFKESKFEAGTFEPCEWYYVAKKKGKAYVSVEFGRESYDLIRGIVNEANTII